MENTKQLVSEEELDKVVEYLIGEWGTRVYVATQDVKSWFEFKESMDYIKETIRNSPVPVEYISFFRIIDSPENLNIPGGPLLFRFGVAPKGRLDQLVKFKFIKPVGREDQEYVREQIQKAVHQIPGTSLKIVEGVRILDTHDLLLKYWEEETPPISDGFELDNNIMNE